MEESAYQKRGPMSHDAGLNLHLKNKPINRARGPPGDFGPRDTITQQKLLYHGNYESRIYRRLRRSFEISDEDPIGDIKVIPSLGEELYVTPNRIMAITYALKRAEQLDCNPLLLIIDRDKLENEPNYEENGMHPNVEGIVDVGIGSYFVFDAFKSKKILRKDDLKLIWSLESIAIQHSKHDLACMVHKKTVDYFRRLGDCNP